MKTFALKADRQISFLALALAVNAAASLIAHRVPTKTVQFAAAFDMCVTVTGLYYWMVVRPGLRPKMSLFLIAFLGLLRASFAFPAVIPGRLLLSSVGELALIGAAVVAFRRSGKSTGSLLATEISIFYYAFAWRAKPDIPYGAKPFTMHRKSGISDLIFFVGLASLLEIVPVHLVVGHWSKVAAWILTGLSVYGAIWAVAMSRSFALRPCWMNEEEILIRFGLLFSLRVPKEKIAAISTEPLPGAFAISARSQAEVYIRFTQPLTAARILGMTKRVEAIGISLDPPASVDYFAFSNSYPVDSPSMKSLSKCHVSPSEEN